MRLVAAPDKMRGTATAREIAKAVGNAAWTAGWDCAERPMADGGEGTLEAFGGANRSTMVTGPLGEPVEAPWRLDGRCAVIEMAQASGLALLADPDDNDPLVATTAGTGELIAQAIGARARRVLVGCGGSATTDGGLPALRALFPLQRLRGVEIEVLCDVDVPFVEAADRFGAQKGATTAQVTLLRRRLERLADVYHEDYGTDVRHLPGAGAAGGLAGGLAVAGARLSPGFDVIADEVDLEEAIDGADLVVTAEGFLDAQSFDGKVVGGVAELAATAGVPCIAIVGDRVQPEELAQSAAYGPGALEVISLTERFGADAATSSTLRCIEEAVTTRLG